MLLLLWLTAATAYTVVCPVRPRRVRPRRVHRVALSLSEESVPSPKRSRIFGSIRRVLFRQKGDQSKESAPVTTKKKEEVGLMLAYEAEDAHMSQNVLDSPDLSDLELWEMARREVETTEKFAKARRDAKKLPTEVEAEKRRKQIDNVLARTWPDLTKFTQLLKSEAVFRLRILGPSFAEPLKAESRWRRSIYQGFLDVVDGAGFFPPANASTFVWLHEVNPGSFELNDRVEEVYDDLIEKRQALRRAKEQFEHWEIRAAKKQLLTEKNTFLSKEKGDDKKTQQRPLLNNKKKVPFWKQSSLPGLPPPRPPQQMKSSQQQQQG